MEHHMTLIDEFFEETNTGKKTIEYRLLDEKRKKSVLGTLSFLREHQTRTMMLDA